MSWLAPKLQLKAPQRQILTPGLVQMVSLLQLNKLELREMIEQELMQNPVLEEVAEDGLPREREALEDGFGRAERERPPSKNFLPPPSTLTDHLEWQLGLALVADEVKAAARSIIGNLNEDGYLTATLDEIAASGDHEPGPVA